MRMSSRRNGLLVSGLLWLPKLHSSPIHSFELCRQDNRIIISFNKCNNIKVIINAHKHRSISKAKTGSLLYLVIPLRILKTAFVPSFLHFLNCSHTILNACMYLIHIYHNLHNFTFPIISHSRTSATCSLSSLPELYKYFMYLDHQKSAKITKLPLFKKNCVILSYIGCSLIFFCGSGTMPGGASMMTLASHSQPDLPSP